VSGNETFYFIPVFSLSMCTRKKYFFSPKSCFFVRMKVFSRRKCLRQQHHTQKEFENRNGKGEKRSKKLFSAEEQKGKEEKKIFPLFDSVGASRSAQSLF
jgi:hypothetical protein